METKNVIVGFVGLGLLAAAYYYFTKQNVAVTTTGTSTDNSGGNNASPNPSPSPTGTRTYADLASLPVGTNPATFYSPEDYQIYLAYWSSNASPTPTPAPPTPVASAPVLVTGLNGTDASIGLGSSAAYSVTVKSTGLSITFTWKINGNIVSPNLVKSVSVDATTFTSTLNIPSVTSNAVITCSASNNSGSLDCGTSNLIATTATETFNWMPFDWIGGQNDGYGGSIAGIHLSKGMLPNVGTGATVILQVNTGDSSYNGQYSVAYIGADNGTYKDSMITLNTPMKGTASGQIRLKAVAPILNVSVTPVNNPSLVSQISNGNVVNGTVVSPNGGTGTVVSPNGNTFNGIFGLQNGGTGTVVKLNADGGKKRTSVTYGM